MKRILIGISIIISLSLALTGCGTDKSFDYTAGKTEKLSEYEAMKIRDELIEYSIEIFEVNSGINAVINESDPGKILIKTAYVASSSKYIKTYIKNIKRMKVPERIEGIHSLLIEQLYWIEDWYDNMRLGLKENNQYLLNVGQKQFEAFFYFHRGYVESLEYMESEDFNFLVVRTSLEIIQKELELGELKYRSEYLQYLEENGTDMIRNDTVDEPEPQEVPSVVIPDDSEVSGPPPQDPLQEEPKYEEQIVANSDVEIMTRKTIQQMELFQINLAKNEIFARHGYIFKDSRLQLYFDCLGWYRPDPTFTEDVFSNAEKTNIVLLKEEENKRKEQAYVVNSNREAWNILIKQVPRYYSTPDLDDDEFCIVYSEPFYCFSIEHFNDDGVMGDMMYAVSLITGKVYNYYSNGEISVDQ